MHTSEIVESILQDAWNKLLEHRDEVKFFDSIVPAQLMGWLEDVLVAQLENLNIIDKEALELKKFSMVVQFRSLITDTIGLDYFLKQIKDTKKMEAIDKLAEKIREDLQDEMAMKRQYR